VVLALVALAAPLGAVPAPAVAGEPVPCEVGRTQYVTEPSNAIASLGIPQTWSLATGKGVVVAVVDSGVEAGNAHLGKAVLPGTAFVPGDQTGREDILGHGTGVAGIIAGRSLGSRSALVGVAPDADILPVRVFQDEDPTGSRPVAFPPDTARMARGIRWAVLHGADVINVSMSTRPTDSALPELLDALSLARRKDVVVVASGGNAESNAPFTQTRYPAGAPGVIGVAATNAVGNVDDWSIHGPQNDVSAPGADVLIAFHDNGDCLEGGERAFTSWSAGFVSGLAAQLRERFPDESADQIAYRIMASADRPRLAERNDIEGWGEIRPYSALTMTLDPNRPGPPLPGVSHQAPAKVKESTVTPLAARSDPLAPARVAAMWWGLLAVGLCALALVLRPWVGALARRRTPRGRRRRPSPTD
jgi:type VII secretion-associated serine protease mycosin